jgi:hypothetical protein
LRFDAELAGHEELHTCFLGSVGENILANYTAENKCDSRNEDVYFILAKNCGDFRYRRIVCAHDLEVRIIDRKRSDVCGGRSCDDENWGANGKESLINMLKDDDYKNIIANVTFTI